MVKLKTLKDFTTKPIYLDFDMKPTTKNSKNLAYCGGCKGDFLEVGCHCGLVDSKELRKEAIKHLKTVRSDKWDTIFYSNPLLIRFFNITEEDFA